MTDIDNAKVIGGKRKNGHKMECKCHICENMKAKASRHGYEEDLKKEQERKMGGPQKKNGHKKDCGCPICKNMKNASGTKKNKGGTKEAKFNGRSSNGRSSNGHKPDCGCPICKNMNKKSDSSKMTSDSEIETDLSKEIEEDAEHKSPEGKKGGSRRKRGTRRSNGRSSNGRASNGRASNGHRTGCSCPICKNMKKKTRKNK